MADDDHRPAKLHIVMFPWLAFGHMIPFLELSKLIALKGHTVSFICTPRNIRRLIPRLPPTSSAGVRFVELPLPSDYSENLPEDAEATTDVPFHLLPFLQLAYDRLQEPVEKFLESSRPDWVFYDYAYWLPAITRRLGISTGFLSAFTAAAVAMIKPPGFEDDRTKPEDFLSPPKWVPFPTTVTFRLYEIRKIFSGFVEEHHGNVSDTFRAAKVFGDSDIMVVRSGYEFEPEWLSLLEDLYRKPVIPVGFLPPSGPEQPDETDTWRSIKEWLDARKNGSVVFVSFGTEAKPSQTELTEIALGLELSGLPFLWVLKSRRGAWDTQPVDVPEGFEERTKGRGLVWRGWAPQTAILSHDSVGALLTHPGWGTIVEAVQFERPMVMLAFMYDQGLNARLLEEKKMAYMVPRDETEGWFTKEAVAASLKVVMDEEQGRVHREKVKEMKGMFGDMDKQDRYLCGFLEYLTAHRYMHK